jgi:lipid-binding SYLF domain-containing protein
MEGKPIANREATTMRLTKRVLVIALLLAPTTTWGRPAYAASAAEIDRRVSAALKTLYSENTTAKILGQKAKAVLVFPSILKAGFIFGGEGGNGALRKGRKTVGYYNTAAASWGLQAGVQELGYALFFMNESALKYLEKSDGWEIGTGPSLVVIDKGFGENLSSTTLQHDVYAVIFSQKGIMGGIGIKGTKVTEIHPGP